MHTRDMRTRTPARKTISVLAAGALALGGLTAVAAPAQAAPAFTTLKLANEVQLSTSGCTQQSTNTQVPGDKTLSDTGSASLQASGSESAAPNMADPTSITANTSLSSTARSQSKNGRPLSLKLDVRATASAHQLLPGNTCKVSGGSMAQLSFAFVVTQPTWITLNAAKQGGTLGQFMMSDGASSIGAIHVDLNFKTTSSTSWLLDPGNYEGVLMLGVQLQDQQTSREVKGNGSYTLSFAAAGSATAKPSGKALGYTSLGSARSCSTNTLSVGVTKSRTKFTRIAKVSWSVNGKTVKTLKGKSLKRGTKVKLRLASAKPASVTTTVKLKSGKTLTARASYRACS